MPAAPSLPAGECVPPGAPRPLPNEHPADRGSGRNSCRDSPSRMVPAAFLNQALDFLGGIGLVAKIGAQPRHDVRHLEPARLLRRGRHQPREDFSAPGDLYRLALLNPCRHARETVSQIPDCRCLHRETTMSHTSTDVNYPRALRPLRRDQAWTLESKDSRRRWLRPEGAAGQRLGWLRIDEQFCFLAEVIRVQLSLGKSVH